MFNASDFGVSEFNPDNGPALTAAIAHAAKFASLSAPQ